MKLNLARIGCTQAAYRVHVPSDSEFSTDMQDHLSRGFAWENYSRDRVPHAVLGSLERTDTETKTEDYSITLSTQMELPSRTRGNPVLALDVLDRCIESGLVVELVANYTCTLDDGTLKMRLPQVLFAEGVFPFTEIRGYRAARVQDDVLVWSAVVDQPGESIDGTTITVTIDSSGSQANSVTALLAESHAVKRSLLIADV